ncbi:hypothetical protein C8F04DRAFT_1198865 [Mycena alexandri]|uniref:Uncharacterized protein n=1 Tax=Mycena alexandri TaxID=1745969 RepID=A0AAD6S021_9AGAR|nr:hypothetical protein C8F04DRAFT_1198865 [Mycena alexandri]
MTPMGMHIQNGCGIDSTKDLNPSAQTTQAENAFGTHYAVRSSHSEDGGTVSGASWVVPPTECDYGGRLVDAIPGTAPHDILDHPVWASCNAGRGLKDSRCSIALAVDRICRPVLVATFLDYAKFPISKDNRGCAVQAQGGKRRIVVGKDRCVKQCPPFIMERSLAYVSMTSPASLGTADCTLPTTYVQSATSAIFCYGSRKTRTSPHRSPAPNEHQECDFRAHVIITSPASLGITEHTLPTTYVQSATSAIFCYGSRKITNPRNHDVPRVARDRRVHAPYYLRPKRDPRRFSVMEATSPHRSPAPNEHQECDFRARVIITSPASLGITEHTLPTTYVQSATSAIFCYGSRKITTFPASLGTAEYTLPTTYVQSTTSAIFCYGSRKTRTSPHRSPAPNEHQECDFRARVIIDDKGSLMRVPSLVPTIRSESSDDWYLRLPPSTVLYEQYPPLPPLRLSSKSEEQYPLLPRLLEPPTSISSTDESSDVATPPSRLVFIPLVCDRVCAFAYRVAWGAVDDVRAAFRAEQHGRNITYVIFESHGALARVVECTRTHTQLGRRFWRYIRLVRSRTVAVRMSTIPRSVASIMAPSERAPSSSSLSEVPMRAGFGFWSESSSLGRTLSVLTQSSFLSDSTAPSPSPSPPPLPESPSTHSPSSPRPSRPPSPSSFSLGTPEASGSVSISTPRGDVPSVRSLLDTVPSYRALTRSLPKSFTEPELCFRSKFNSAANSQVHNLHSGELVHRRSMGSNFASMPKLRFAIKYNSGHQFSGSMGFIKVEHARNPVLFQQAVAKIKEDNVFKTACILDIGPTPTAWVALQSNNLSESTLLLSSSAKKGKDQELAFLTAIASLVEFGMNPDFTPSTLFSWGEGTRVKRILHLSASSAQDHRRAQSLSLACSIVSTAQMGFPSFTFTRAHPRISLTGAADTLPSLNIQFVGRCVTARWRDDGLARWDGAVTSTGRRGDECIVLYIVNCNGITIEIVGRSERYRTEVARKVADDGDLRQIYDLAWSGMVGG